MPTPSCLTTRATSLTWCPAAAAAFALVLSSAAWFVMTVVVVCLPATGFAFSAMQLFWLTAAPGLAAWVLRVVHWRFLPALTVQPAATIALAVEVIALIWLGWAMQNPKTPWLTFMTIGFLCGAGGGIFASLSASATAACAGRWPGQTLTTQAGLAIFGVILVQTVTPYVVGVAELASLTGSPQPFRSAQVIKDVAVTRNANGAVTDIVPRHAELAAALVVTRDGEAIRDVMIKPTEATRHLRVELKITGDGKVVDAVLRNVIEKKIWLQNAAFVWVPFLLLAMALCAVFLKHGHRSENALPGDRQAPAAHHQAGRRAWNFTITQIGTWGSLLGFSAAFPLLIHTTYGSLENAREPLAYAFVGPLLGGLVLAVSGSFVDRIGGGRGVRWSVGGQLAACLFLVFGGYLTPTSAAQFQGFLWGMSFLFLMAGLGSAAAFRLHPIVGGVPANPAQMLAWVGAWAAFGPFAWDALLGASQAATGNGKVFFVGLTLFYAGAWLLNWRCSAPTKDAR